MKFIESQLNLELLDFDTKLQKEVKEYIENLEKEYKVKFESSGTAIIKEYEHYKRIIEGQYSVKIMEMQRKMNDRLVEYRKLLF
jgi:predicted SpoU family rRNA methylase